MDDVKENQMQIDNDLLKEKNNIWNHYTKKTHSIQIKK